MQTLFRKLPKVDILMNSKELEIVKNSINSNKFYQLVKDEIEKYRTLIKNREITDFSIDEIINNIISNSKKVQGGNLKKVINGTGVIIHTNLGRSILNEQIGKRILETSTNYNNLEYDIKLGKRGDRNSHIEKLITKITGAESALIVNNNAAAVILCLNEFAKNKNVIVSRGELVEIGGAFRIPDIMELSGAKLKEVGTTNKTHLWDYENAITEETSMILKVHTSNFKILGFVESTDNLSIAKLGKEKNVITMEDLGSGILIDLSKYGITKEPTVQESVKSGIDLITISGDKLLGGPQCGIILGKKEYIDRLKKNQYLRAFRVDKLVLTALETTLEFYLDEREAVREIPTLKMITEDKEVVYKKAETLQKMFDEIGIQTKIIKSLAKIGGGSMPEECVDSFALAFSQNPLMLEERFRLGENSIIGRIQENSYILDLKTIFEDDFSTIIEKAKKIGIADE